MVSSTTRALEQTRFQGWNAYALRQGDLLLHVVPEVGGRLMGIAFNGVELCFVHPDLRGRTFDGSPQAWPALCTDWTFPLWGGGKTWVAPESAWPGGAPHRDLDSLAWAVQSTWCDAAGMGIAVQSPVCSQSHLQIERRLSLMPGAAAWTIEHVLSNRGDSPVRCGIWDVLMLNRPGVVSIALPHSTPETVVALPGKPGVSALQQDGILVVLAGQAQVACTAAGEFKLGFASAQGELQVDFPGTGLRYARSSMVSQDQAYAHGKPLEVFNAPALPYFEVETNSPLAHLLPGHSLHYVIHERVGVSQEPSISV